jgi:uncharacterized peroxidase-related enzyme
MATTAAPPISRLRVPAEEELPASVRAIFDATRRSKGRVDNWSQAVSLGGEHFARLAAYFGPLLAPTGARLPWEERELIATVVSAETGCSYCRLNHTHSLGEALGGDVQTALRVALDFREVEELTPRQRALGELAAKIAVAPRSVEEADLDGLREHGLDDEDLFEAIQLASIFAALNRLSIVLGVRPDDAFFAIGGAAS